MPGGDKLDQETQYYVGNNNIYAPYRYGVDHERVFTGTLSFRTPEKGHKPIMMANFQKALDTGNVEAIFNARARQLVKDDAGRIVGVIFEDVTTGEYTQVNGTRGVVLATGGYVRNDELLAHYMPWIYNLKGKFTFHLPPC